VVLQAACGRSGAAEPGVATARKRCNFERRRDATTCLICPSQQPGPVARALALRWEREPPLTPCCHVRRPPSAVEFVLDEEKKVSEHPRARGYGAHLRARVVRVEGALAHTFLPAPRARLCTGSEAYNSACLCSANVPNSGERNKAGGQHLLGRCSDQCCMATTGKAHTVLMCECTGAASTRPQDKLWRPSSNYNAAAWWAFPEQDTAPLLNGITIPAELSSYKLVALELKVRAWPLPPRRRTAP